MKHWRVISGQKSVKLSWALALRTMSAIGWNSTTTTTSSPPLAKTVHSSKKLYSMRKEVNRNYLEAHTKFSASGQNDNEYCNFVKGRGDVLYLRKWLSVSKLRINRSARPSANCYLLCNRKKNWPE
ncbi:hypothetical protein GN244_ATG08579 [Phytophthora infestans]|uniref:Uncharacterized protein n=1 Tax=Phytophthora infestans TaxID=4787 RepID=A0A833TA26_PHYIN|nr:hypothetical protein GN244_ATG08579 [Phytophthora infestans]